MPISPPRSPARLVALSAATATVLVALLVAGCASNRPAPTSTPSGTPVLTAPTPTVNAPLPATAAPGASTPAASSPTSAPGAPPAAEPTASTGALPLASLKHATYTSGATSVTLPIEVPPEREYSIGLSGRRSLEGRGMLFSFPDGVNVGFWMKNTHIDLDIAFVDRSMTVLDIRSMRADTLDIHQPSGTYIAAVEAPIGWYAANGVKIGAKVAFDVDLKAATGR